jgi:hypothetical protein
VTDDHETELHMAVPTDMDAVSDVTPKFTPYAEIMTPCESGRLRASSAVTVGASYEKMRDLVPICVAIVTASPSCVKPPTGSEHCNDVAESHDDVLHEVT